MSEHAVPGTEGPRGHEAGAPVDDRKVPWRVFVFIGAFVGLRLGEMLALTRAVSRSVERALVLGDLPFGSYQASPEQGYLTAARFMKEGGCHAVKLEGGQRCAPQIEARSTACSARADGASSPGRWLEEVMDEAWRGARGGATQAALLRLARSRCTSSSEIAAGVMPGMRCAWPTVCGRTCSSFCRSSADRPRTAA